MTTLLIADLMESSGVKFGTSCARGRVEDMTDQVCYAYTTAFLQYLSRAQQLVKGSPVGLAGDRRRSTPRIMAACACAITDLGFEPVNCGYIPSPAKAIAGSATDCRPSWSRVATSRMIATVSSSTPHSVRFPRVRFRRHRLSGW
jgi:phosphomannomutase